jgi:hypothetical protein
MKLTKQFIIFIIVAAYISHANASQLALEGPETSIEAGQIFSIDITIDAIQNFYGAALDIIYDGNMLRVYDSDFKDGIAEGVLMSENMTVETILLSRQVNTGRLVLGIVRSGNTSGIYLSQKKTLLTIYFEALTQGTTQISCDSLLSNLKDVSLNNIETTFLDINITASGFAPETPYSPYPHDNSLEISTQPVLTWLSKDMDPDDQIVFDIHLGTDPNPGLHVSGIAKSEYGAELLEYETEYFWRVRATDSKGVSKVGPVWSFTTFSSTGDADSDGLTNMAEVEIYHTNPHNPDTDGDGMADAWEIIENWDPLVDNSIVEKGDVDSSRIVNLLDLIIVLQELGDVYTPPDHVNIKADVDGDNRIGLEEAIYILKHIED